MTELALVKKHRCPVTLANLEHPIVVPAFAEVHLCTFAWRACLSAECGCAVHGDGAGLLQGCVLLKPTSACLMLTGGYSPEIHEG